MGTEQATTALVTIPLPPLPEGAPELPTDRERVSIIVEGRPLWSATMVGEILGYADPAKLAHNIRNGWANELVEGVDHIEVAGRDLKPYKAARVVGRNAPSHLFLTETGLYLACVKAETPFGATLRRWFATEVMPSIARTGGYRAPEVHEPRSVESPNQPADRTLDVDMRLARELRLAGNKQGAQAVLAKWVPGQPAAPALPGPVGVAYRTPAPEGFTYDGLGNLGVELGLGTPKNKPYAKAKALLQQLGLWDNDAWHIVRLADRPGGGTEPHHWFRGDIVTEVRRLLAERRLPFQTPEGK